MNGYGTSSLFGQDIAAGAWTKAGFSLFLLVSFCGGAAISSVCTEVGRRRRWESIYVLPIAIEALLLTLFALSVEIHNSREVTTGLGLYLTTGFASLAMGLQNATISHISGGSVRTTHVTGVLTDLGVEVVQLLWKIREDGSELTDHVAHRRLTVRRIALLGSVIASFILGAYLGTWAHQQFLRWAMFPPAAFLGWLIYQDITKPIAEIQPASLVGIMGDDLPPALQVFRLQKDTDRHGRTHRMPNLLNWSERLASNTQVVVLDLGEVRQLDANAALELRAVLVQFASRGRQLVIAGVSQEQFRQLTSVGEGDLLSGGSLCPDLELAIARGLSFLHD